MKPNKRIILLTGVEGDLLRIEVSLTLNREHLDWVAGARCQVGEVGGQASPILRQFFVAFDLHAVTADVTRPR